MLKKTVLIGTLALILINPMVVSSESSPTDSAITAKIKALYAQSSALSATPLSVVSTNQHVFLTGQLATDSPYAQAILLAQSVDGVIDVNADKLLVVIKNAPLLDTYITAEAKGIILQKKILGANPSENWPINIETKNGVVYLTGKVDTDEQRVNIMNAVKNIADVKSINSTITLK